MSPLRREGRHGREDIIKRQWKMKSTRESWFGKNYNFLLIDHEHLYVFRKLEEGERAAKFKESRRWGSNCLNN